MARVKRKRPGNMTRGEFLQLVEDLCPSRAAARKIADGDAELLGLFMGERNRWVVQVEMNGSVSYFHVTPISTSRATVTWKNWMPSWSLWIGDETDTRSPINLGDNPGTYRRLKEQGRGRQNHDHPHH
jgi:hypothetical protein